MMNILKVGERDLVTCVQFFPDCIRFMALISSGSSRNIQIFLVDAGDFEVFSYWFIPIKGIIWVFSYKGVQLVDWIYGVN